MNTKGVEDGTELVCNRCWRIVGMGGIIKDGTICNIYTSNGYRCEGVFKARPREVLEGVPQPTKGVEDGMSDDQECKHCNLRIYWRTFTGTKYGRWFHAEGHQKDCLGCESGRNCTEAEPSAAIRSATPEELTAQAESRGENYKPGPRQATPFMPAEEEDADCEGCNRVDCKGCAYNDAHPPPDFVTKAGTRVYIPPAAVPVEERTAEIEQPEIVYRAEYMFSGEWCFFGSSPDEARARRGYEDMKPVVGDSACRLVCVKSYKTILDHIEGQPK